MKTLTYRYRLKGKRAVRRLRRLSWAVNQAWNFCVATQRTAQRRWTEGGRGRWPGWIDLDALARGVAADLGVMADTITQVCRQFVRSRDHRRMFPRFRASGGPRRALGWVPFRTRDMRIGGNAVSYLGQTFRWFGSKRRPLPPVTRDAAFVEDASGRWFVCLTVDIEDERATGAGQVGIDLGLKHLAVTSDGEKFENLTAFRTWQTKLATAQRAGNKARARAIHWKIRNVRHDHLHKCSARLTAANRLIAVGNVRLASKSALDAGWSTFREMLRYKASRHGATYLEVNEAFTTQTCSTCGSLPASRPRGIAGLGIREWRCSDCGATHDRDVNAARNILSLALSNQRRADESGESPIVTRRGAMVIAAASPPPPAGGK